MNGPLLTWICVTTAVVLIVLVRLFYLHGWDSLPKRLFGFVHEWELFYIPGDKIIHDDYEIDDDDC